MVGGESGLANDENMREHRRQVIKSRLRAFGDGGTTASEIGQGEGWGKQIGRLIDGDPLVSGPEVVDGKKRWYWKGPSDPSSAFQDS